MHIYETLRQFADSWVLLVLTGIFLGVIGFAFRPGSRAGHTEAANTIFRHDDRPAPGPIPAPNAGTIAAPIARKDAL